MDVTLVADKGGVGKTTVAYHLCARLKQLGEDVALIDLDQQAAAFDWVAEAEGEPFPAYRFDLLHGDLPDHEHRIWDTPAHPSVEMRRALAKLADVVVVVAGPDLPSQQAAAEVYRLFVELGANGVAMLFNGVWPTGSEGRQSIESAEEAGLWCLPVAIRHYKAFQHCRWSAEAVCDGPYNSADQAWSDICRVVEAILTWKER